MEPALQPETIRPPTLDRVPTASQLEAARSLPDNADATFPAKALRISTDRYLDDSWYQREQECLFRSLPLPLGPSALLGNPGSFVCRDVHGQSVILSRDADGRIHAFLNACRHRGSRLTDACEPTQGRLLVCPYHAWSYDLKGRLVGVPRAELFADLDKSALGLVAVPCHEQGGIIWVSLRSGADGEVSRELTDDLDALGLPTMHMFAQKQHDVAANWKLILDTFLEGYHVIRLHAASLGPLYEDTVTRVDALGSHLRQTSGRRGFRHEMVADPQLGTDKLRRSVTFVYTLIPNAALICSQDYVNLLIMHPQGPRRTLVENFMLTNIEPDSDKLRDKWQRSLALTDGLAFPEDFAAAAASQRGLDTGAVEEVIIGGLEEGMEHFHRIVDRHMGAAHPA